MIGHSAIEHLTSNIINFGSSSNVNDGIHNLCDNLHNDEKTVLENQSKLIDFADKCAKYLNKKETGLIEDDNSLFAIH